MNKKVFITSICFIFLTALCSQASEQSGNRQAGQCSYHGGYNKDTGKCNDGTSAGAYGSPDKPEKPDPAERERVRACKKATSKYNSLANSKTWRKIQSQHLGDSADDCREMWEEKYEPKIEACKTESCKVKYEAILRKKNYECERVEAWALKWGDQVEEAENAMNAACQ
jgi:hypothetical protein